MSTDPLGTDISTPGGSGLDPYLSLVSGGACLCQALARRLQTPRGSLYRHPSYGWDLRQYVNDDLVESDLRDIERAAAEECRADQRVDDVQLAASFDGTTLRLAGTVYAITGQAFPLVLAVSEISVALIRSTETQ